MPPLSYDEIWTHIHFLSLKEQARLLKELAVIVEAHIAAQPRRNVMEFKGVGKETWEGVDVKQFIEEERNSWE